MSYSSSVPRAQSDFYKSGKFAVVGASNDRTKFGNKVFRWYLDQKLSVVPINPKGGEIEGHVAVKSLSELDNPSEYSVSIITPPKVTTSVINQAAEVGIKHVWMQPGSESDEALRIAKERGVSVVSGGPCVLVHGEDALRHATAKM
ncbi:CoA binding domain-containing protein [Phlyctochytrium arcticum]|nr:CoA binding domain-containing protein [Phlyctochytrium arcticum]